jgi:hypothetical protein
MIRHPSKDIAESMPYSIVHARADVRDEIVGRVFEDETVQQHHAASWIVYIQPGCRVLRPSREAISPTIRFTSTSANGKQ